MDGYGLIIEPLDVLRNRELEVSTPNWPPPPLAVVYELISRGNNVYRIEAAALLPSSPAEGEEPPMIMNGAWHLRDVLESLGVKKVGVWVGRYEFLEGDSARIIAWAL